MLTLVFLCSIDDDRLWVLPRLRFGRVDVFVGASLDDEEEEEEGGTIDDFTTLRFRSRHWSSLELRRSERKTLRKFVAPTSDSSQIGS